MATRKKKAEVESEATDAVSPLDADPAEFTEIEQFDELDAQLAETPNAASMRKQAEVLTARAEFEAAAAALEDAQNADEDGDGEGEETPPDETPDGDEASGDEANTPAEIDQAEIDRANLPPGDTPSTSGDKLPTGGQVPAVRQAKVFKASADSETLGDGELATATLRASHIGARKNQRKDGAVLGYTKFNRAALTNDQILRAGATQAEHQRVIALAQAAREEQRKINKAGLAHKANCGCSGCGNLLEAPPEVFCNTGSEINQWFTGIPMEDQCVVERKLRRDTTPPVTTDWAYGCVPTGEIGKNGETLYFPTGKIVYGEDGSITVPEGWDPNNPETWKDTNVLQAGDCKTLKYALIGTSVAYDVARSRRLCDGAHVDRELARGARELDKMQAVRGLTALTQNAIQSGFWYDGDGTDGLSFADGLISLIADELDALAYERCLDLSQWTAFVIGAPQKWLNLETIRSGGKVSAAGALQECFGDVITTKCRPAGMEAPKPAGGTAGAEGPVTLTPAKCTRTVRVIAAPRNRWIVGEGERYELHEDRSCRGTALGNGEFHFLEEDYVHLPTDDDASMVMDFTLNNKGQCVEDGAGFCG